MNQFPILRTQLGKLASTIARGYATKPPVIELYLTPPIRISPVITLSALAMIYTYCGYWFLQSVEELEKEEDEKQKMYFKNAVTSVLVNMVIAYNVTPTHYLSEYLAKASFLNWNNSDKLSALVGIGTLAHYGASYLFANLNHKENEGESSNLSEWLNSYTVIQFAAARLIEFGIGYYCNDYSNNMLKAEIAAEALTLIGFSLHTLYNNTISNK